MAIARRKSGRGGQGRRVADQPRRRAGPIERRVDPDEVTPPGAVGDTLGQIAHTQAASRRDIEDARRAACGQRGQRYCAVAHVDEIVFGQATRHRRRLAGDELAGQARREAAFVIPRPEQKEHPRPGEAGVRRRGDRALEGEPASVLAGAAVERALAHWTDIVFQAASHPDDSPPARGAEGGGEVGAGGEGQGRIDQRVRSETPGVAIQARWTRVSARASASQPLRHRHGEQVGFDPRRRPADVSRSGSAGADHRQFPRSDSAATSTGGR